MEVLNQITGKHFGHAIILGLITGAILYAARVTVLPYVTSSVGVTASPTL